MRDFIEETIDTYLQVDPAARSRLEIILCYPGFHAIVAHRLAHRLWLDNFYTLARFISHLARILTGIEIHPGATLGRRLVIDHGMGVVIGETAEIGEDCFIYQGVTLGAGAEARQGELTRGKKRHPSLGNRVVVGSGAEIQGAINIGDNVRVASGSIVLKDVPDNSIVVGVPGRVIYKDGKRVKDGENLPDMEAEAIKSLKNRLDSLEKYLESNEVVVHDVGAPEKNSDPVDEFLQGAGI